MVFCYHLEKTAAESHRMLVEAYGEHALGKTQYFEWFKKFKSGNFDVRNEDRGKPPKKFEDWDQKGVIYYELLKPGETVNTNRHQQQMIDLNRALQEKRPHYQRRQHNSILRAWAHNEGYCVTSDNARRRSKPRQSRDEAKARSVLRALSRVS